MTDLYSADDQTSKKKVKSPSKYLRAFDRYDRLTKDWRQAGQKVTQLYMDEKRTPASPRRFALLWSNIETLKPAIYAKLPIAVVSRRFKDADPVGRQAGEVLERCINTTFDIYNFDAIMQNVRDDRLLPGRGTCWVRYEAQTEGQKINSEKVCIDFVHWRDFGHSMDRTWPEVTLVWRRVYMNKVKAKERFGKIAETLTYDMQLDAIASGSYDYDDIDKTNASDPQTCIYEVWDKDLKQVAWIAKEDKKLLDSGEPPLNFRDFWPCPMPVFGTHSSRSLIPQPDYKFYQDQAEEINDLTEKIGALQEWLVLKAFIPSGPSSDGGGAIVQLLQDMQDKFASKGIFVPVESWAGFTEKGGSKMIDWLPMDMVAATLKAAIELRSQLIQDVYQITGISDILRGQTNPNETLGAQELKAQTGSKRISTLQRDLARFARDVAELVGEVICDNFQPETMSAMSGFDLTSTPPAQLLMKAQSLAAQIQPSMMPPQDQQDPQAQQAMQAQQQQAQQQMQMVQAELQQIKQNAAVLQLLRDDRTRGYRIEIETDSTIEPNETAEKQRRVEFIQAVGGFMQQAMPVAQSQPELLPAMKEMLLFLARGFRAGRQLEDSLEQAADQLEQVAMQPRPNPEQQKLKQEAQLHAQKMQQDAQLHAAKLAQDAQLHQQEIAQKDQQFKQDMVQRTVEHQNNMTTELNKARIQNGSPLVEHEQQVTQLNQLAQNLLGAFQQALDRLQNIENDMNAPAQVLYGQDGRVSGVKRGSRTIQVQRNRQSRLQ